MTTLKIEGKPAAAASEALEPHVRRLYDRPGLRLMVVGELEHVERTQPAPGSDKTASVKVKFTHIEVAGADQEGYIREALRALFLQRTARGTLDDDSGQLELTPDTLRLAGGMLHAIEVARLRAGLDHWAGYARRVVHNPDLSLTEVRHELDTIAEGLTLTLSGARPDGDDVA